MKINRALMSAVELGDREMSVCGEIENIHHENRVLNEESLHLYSRLRYIEERIKLNLQKVKMLEES